MSYPYELLRVPGSEAVKTLFELQEKGGGTPIILGNEEGLESDKFAGAFDRAVFAIYDSSKDRATLSAFKQRFTGGER